MDGTDDFEAWLQQELRALVRSVPGSRPRAAQAAYHSGRLPRPGRRLRGAAGRGLAAGIATAVVLGAGAISVAAAATGSVDPVSWGHAVVRMVEGCRQPACGPVPASVVHTPGPGGAAGAPATPWPGTATGHRTEPGRTPTEDSTPGGSGKAQQPSGQDRGSGTGAPVSGPAKQPQAKASAPQEKR